MNKPANRPGRVADEDLDKAVKEGVERADETNELSNDDLGDVNGGLVPGKLIVDQYIDQ